MPNPSYKLIETEMDFVSRSTRTKSFPTRLPGSRQRYLCNSSIHIFEEYLRTGHVESYSYVFEVIAPTRICFQIDSPQTHLLYHLDGRRPIGYTQPDVADEFIFRPQHGAVFYIPQTVLYLQFEPGNYLVQGFTLPMDMLDQHELSGFDYLSAIIEAYRYRNPQYRASLDFDAMQHTRRLLDEFGSGLSQPSLIPQLVALRTIQDLLYLSKDKMQQAKGLFSHHDFIVEQARTLISRQVAEQEVRVLIKDIASALCIEEKYLNRLHKKRHGVPISDYHHSELFKKTKHCLDQYQSIKLSAAKCGFSDPTSFTRFFRKHAKMSPKQYLNKTGLPPMQ